MDDYQDNPVDPTDEELRDPSNDEELLEEIRRHYSNDTQYWAEIRAEGDEDTRFRTGDSWQKSERDARTMGAPETQRLCLNYDELNQNLNQVINNFRLNKPGIKVEPKGYGADAKTAELRGDKIRQIEYQSNAGNAYSVAFDNQVSRSYGFVEIIRQFDDPESFDQEIYIKAIHNPNVVTPDPNGVMADGSDWMRCFKEDYYSPKEFKAKWPRAKFSSFGSDINTDFAGWFTEKRIRAVEYWKILETDKTLISLDAEILLNGKPKGTLVVEDYDGLKIEKAKTLAGRRVKYLVAPTGERIATIRQMRKTQKRQVIQYIASGAEILEENPQPGEFIPIVPFYGQQIWMNDGSITQRRIQSLIRLARDPQTAYSYLKTTQMEVVGQIPKTPYVGYVGQFAGMEGDWANVNKVRMAFLQAHATTDEVPQGTVLPLPQQTHYEPAVQAMEIMGESTRRAIQSAMGVSPLPTQALRNNEKSGVALKQISTNQSIGSYHFTDNANLSIQHVGRIVDSWLKPVYDTKRDVGLRSEDGKHTLKSNVDDGGNNLFAKGEHMVTISVGPSYDSQRQEASEFADTLASSNPQVFALTGDLIVKLKQLGPIGDQIAKRLKFLQPPELRQQEAAEDGGQDPGEVAKQQVAMLTQKLQQMQMILQELKPKADDNMAKLQSTQMQQQGSIQKEQITAQNEMARVRMELEAETQRLQMQLETQKEIAAANNRTTLVAKLMDKTSETNLEVLNHEVEAIHKDLDQKAQRETLELSHQQVMEQQAAQVDQQNKLTKQGE